MKVNVLKYLKRNLQPDPDIDLTDEVLSYVADLERKAESLEKIRAAGRRWSARNYEQNKQRKHEYYLMHKEKWARK